MILAQCREDGHMPPTEVRRLIRGILEAVLWCCTSGTHTAKQFLLRLALIRIEGHWLHPRARHVTQRYQARQLGDAHLGHKWTSTIFNTI